MGSEDHDRERVRDIVERLGKCVAVSEMIGDNPVVMKDAIDEITRLRAENEKLRKALAAERERCAKIAEQARDDTCDGPVAWSMADSIAAAIRESGNE